MIVGIGIDLCLVERIRRSLRRFGDTYVERIFTEQERMPKGRQVDQAAFYARAFCSKEACAKALGTGFSRGVIWKEIEILQRRNGVTLQLSGTALDRLRKLIPAKRHASLHLTCTNNKHFAQALVVILADSDVSKKKSFRQ